MSCMPTTFYKKSSKVDNGNSNTPDELPSHLTSLRHLTMGDLIEHNLLPSPVNFFDIFVSSILYGLWLI